MKITSEKDLRKIYDQPKARTLKKELSKLDKHCIHFLEKSPFMVLSTVGKNGEMDASPRGGKPGFAKVLSPTQLVMADAKGNNRLDSITNIVETGKVGTLFMIPGIDETMRLNGTAEIRTDLDLLALFPEEQNPPKTCIVITIETVFLQCAKALMRSKLWENDFKIEDRNDFPSMGEIMKDHTGIEKAPETREEMLKRYQGDL